MTPEVTISALCLYQISREPEDFRNDMQYSEPIVGDYTLRKYKLMQDHFAQFWVTLDSNKKEIFLQVLEKFAEQLA